MLCEEAKATTPLMPAHIESLPWIMPRLTYSLLISTNVLPCFTYVGYSQLVRSSYKAGINKTEINANQNIFNGQDWSIIAVLPSYLNPSMD